MSQSLALNVPLLLAWAAGLPVYSQGSPFSEIWSHQSRWVPHLQPGWWGGEGEVRQWGWLHCRGEQGHILAGANSCLRQEMTQFICLRGTGGKKQHYPPPQGENITKQTSKRKQMMRRKDHIPEYGVYL